METPIKVTQVTEAYKILITEEVEAKIRLFCRRSWDKEWSGVLFYTIKGTFENKDLEIVCRDIYLMDIGTAGSTTFDVTADVACYIANNNELLEEGVYQGLIHSHNTMDAFFSGTDAAAISQEANDMPHFVSLVVNNKGVYVACLTRKGELKQSRTEILTYPTWGGEYTEETRETESITEVIYQHPLTIVFDLEENSFLYESDARFTEVQTEKTKKAAEEAKKAAASYKTTYYFPNYDSRGYKSYNQNQGLKINEGMKLPHEINSKPPVKKEMKTLPKVINSKLEVDTQEKLPFDSEVIYDYSLVKPDAKIIDSIVIQLLTGSVLVDPKNADIKKWCKSMNKIYKLRFPYSYDFTTFAIGQVEFLLNSAVDDNLEAYYAGDAIAIQGCLAFHTIAALAKLPKNDWIDEYIECLETYLEM